MPTIWWSLNALLEPELVVTSLIYVKDCGKYETLGLHDAGEAFDKVRRLATRLSWWSL